MKVLCLLIVSLILGGCASPDIDSFKTLEINNKLNSAAQSEDTISYHGIPLSSGQIIASNSNTALNFIVTLTDSEHHPYAHVGIISIEQGKPYVYHAYAQLRLLFKGSPTDLTKGVIRRSPLTEFLKEKAVVAIYNPESPTLGKSMADFAIQSHAQRLPYDALFDEVDRSQVYCSEFIVSAIESAGGSTIPLRPRNRHPSIDIIYDWLSIKAMDHYFVSDLLTDRTRVALLSEKLTPMQIELYIGLREELHQRFTSDQKIGNIMSWTGFGVKLRPQIELFIQRGIDGDFRQPHTGETRGEWISSLANDVFGPIADRALTSSTPFD